MDSMERLPRLEHKMTPQGDLFVLTKPGTSMKLYLDAKELQSLTEQGNSLLHSPVCQISYK